MALAIAVIVVLSASSAAAASRGPYCACVLVHGIAAGEERLTGMESWINRAFPDMFTYRARIGNGMQDSMLRDMNWQVEQLREELRNISARLGDGFVMLAHSQGTLVARGYIERYNDPPAKAFVSLAGIHGGLFGSVPVNDSLLDFLVTTMAYQPLVQHHVSFAGYWKDPFHYQQYLDGSLFLADINNERPGLQTPLYRANILSLDYMLLTFGSLDEVIVPHVSGWFGFFALNSTSEVVPPEQTDGWKGDWLGLRTLNETSRLGLYWLPLDHDSWTYDPGMPFFNEHIVPILRGDYRH